MKRTISIRLDTTTEQDVLLLQLQEAYHCVCNQIIRDVISNRCCNRVALHRLVYSKSSLTNLMVALAVSNFSIQNTSYH